jgi:protease I
MAEILFVIAQKGFRDEEFTEPYKMLKNVGHAVTVASTSAGEAQGKLGLRVKPDVSIDRVDPSRYNAVVVVGGPGTPAYIWPNVALQKALRAVYDKGGIVAAICLAPVVLARAGLIKNKKCTVFPTAESLAEIKGAGGLLVNQSVVIDGRIVTGNGPDAAVAFGEALLKLIK